MTFDTTRGVVMLFGGFLGSAFDAQTWTWNGTAWAQLVTATVPPASPFPSLSFFEPHGVAVLTLGTGAASQPLQTFVHDGADWSAGPSAPTGFTSRQGHATSFDARREMVVLFGGARVGPGGAVATADTWELSIRATFEPFGTGCAFAAGTPMLDAVAGSRPQLGDTLQLEVMPAGAAALFVAGTSDTTFLGAPLPLDLAPIGLPGCHLFTSADVAVAAPVTAGVATTSIVIPPHRTLLGAQFFVQALALDAGAPVPGALSNAGRATIGN
jgi:hypothetical protein